VKREKRRGRGLPTFVIRFLLTSLLLAAGSQPEFGVGLIRVRAQAERARAAACLETEAQTPVRKPCPPQEQPEAFLPDLVPLPPGDLIVISSAATGRRELRLTTSFANLGPGRLELSGEFNPESAKTAVTQHIYGEDGPLSKSPAGEFVYHPDHYHWHLENFVRYELWTLTSSGRIDQLAALTDKLSFCLRDIYRAQAAGPAGQAFYIYCGQEQQGISPGWVDTYRYDIPGQLIDISGLPDGLYALRLVVDPDNRVLEKFDTNNTVRITIEIFGRQVRILSDAKEIRLLLDAAKAVVEGCCRGAVP